MLKRKIVQFGNSWGVVIPKTVLQMLNLNPVKDNRVELYIQDNEIRIRKAQDKESD